MDEDEAISIDTENVSFYYFLVKYREKYSIELIILGWNLSL